MAAAAGTAKMYVIADFQAAVLTPSAHMKLSDVTSSYRTVRSKPRKTADARHCMVSSEDRALEAIARAITRYRVRKYDTPDTVRCHPSILAHLGNPTHVYGIKVTK